MRSSSCTIVLLAVLVTGCTDVGLPQRGFATLFFHSEIEPELNPPQAFDGTPLLPDGKPARPDSCEVAARARAQDVAAQDFGEDVQKKVFEATLADCKRWRARS